MSFRPKPQIKPQQPWDDIDARVLALRKAEFDAEWELALQKAEIDAKEAVRQRQQKIELQNKNTRNLDIESQHKNTRNLDI